MILSYFLTFFLAYLCGSLPFGFLAGKIKGIDIREHGSGNIGATNAWRILGKSIGITILLLDILKGFLPVFFLSRYPVLEGTASSSLTGILAALATILGHNYTCWLKFKGGKGIATSAGALLALLPLAVGIGLVVWIVTFLLTRYVSIASMLAALTIPLVVLYRTFPYQPEDLPLILFSLALALLAIWRHKSNIRNLLTGREYRFNKKSSP